MSDEPLVIDEVQIRRAPGFASGGFTVSDLSEGINIVHGPNGSGKSTLAQSVQGMLWPRSVDDRYSLLGRFSTEEDEWRIDRDGGRARYQRNGSDTNRPGLPSSEQRDRYYLSLHDLIQDDTRDGSFARRIQQESIGGYDLEAAYETLGFDEEPSTRGINEYKTAVRAREAWQEAKQEAEQLKQKEARLPTLTSRLQEAEEASDEVELCELAIGYREAKQDLEQAQEALETFPAVLDDVTGEEAERIAELDATIETEQADLREARETKGDAVETLDELALPEDGIPDGALAELKHRRDRLASLENDRDRFRSELEAAKKRRETALEETPLDVDGNLSMFDPEAWEEVAEFGATADYVRANRQAKAAIERWLGEEESKEGDIATLRQGTRSLEEWLAAGGDPRPALETAAFRVGAAGAIAVGAAGLALGVLVDPLLFGTVALALGLIWYGYRAGRTDEEGGRQESHEKSFAHTDLEPPESWTREAVRDRVIELNEAIAEAKLDHERAERRAALVPQDEELAQREQALEKQRDRLKEEYGLTIEPSETELLAITRGIIRWQEANAEVRSREARIEWVTHLIDREREELAYRLDPYGYGPVPDSSTATGHIQVLEERDRKFETATRELEQANQRIRDAIDRIETLARKRRAVYRKLELDDGAFDELGALCDQVGAFDDARTAVTQQEKIVEDRRETLERHPEFQPDVLETPITELETRKDEAEERASSAERLREQITTIETRVEDAKSDYDLEAKMEERDRALDALEDRLEADTEAMVGDVLVNHLREETKESSRPAVFERARETLARITKGRYELDVDDGAFRVYDTVNERGFALDELSSGSRLQVLLAVRLAFLEQQEQGVGLPLLLDETLANSDDGRATVIIESVIELARAGRQVFYFTAQGDEVAKWRSALASTDIEHTTIDLASVRELSDGVEVPEIVTLATDERSLPDPNGHDHESYGEALDVPAFDPHRGAGSAHLWYVVEDTEVLHRLLRFGVERWGQLETLLEQTDASDLINDEQTLRRVERNGTALNEFVSCWTVGRGERVDRRALEETDAVSDNFIERVTDLAREVNGDAEAIVRALRDGQINRFRTGKIDELERYFEEHGYIEDRETLGAETIRVRVINRIRGAGLTDDEAFDQADGLFDRLALYGVTR